MIRKHVLIQSYVKERYFISTIRRDSSCAEFPYPYYETMAWHWDKATRKTGELIDQLDGVNAEDSAIAAHIAFCTELAAQEEKCQP